MKRFKLVAEPRKVTGKQVKKLRRDGILPANVYGKDIKSQSLQLPLTEFLKVFTEAGETGVIDLTYGTSTVPVLIHNLHTDYRNTPLHADFFKVNLKEKVTAMVPIEIVGEPKAVTEQIGLLMEITPEVEVEALPTDLPEKIELNVENLANIDDQVTVEQLNKPEGVEIITDGNLVVVKIAELISKEAQEDAAAAEAQAEAAAAETTEGAEGATPAEGETKTEDGASSDNQNAPKDGGDPTRQDKQGAAGGKPQE